MKPVYLLALLPATLFINGCDDSESEVCRYYIQNDIDNSNFNSAITRLEDKSCQETYPENQHLIDLSSAYLGRAGLPLSVVMRAMIEDENSGEELTYQTFVADISKSASPTVLSDLDNSRQALDDYLTSTSTDESSVLTEAASSRSASDGEAINNSCKAVENPTSAQETVWLITGFIDVLKTAMAIDTLSAGNIDAWVDSDGAAHPSSLRASCALKYSYEHKHDVEFALPYMGCEDGVSIDSSEEVTFTSAGRTVKTYNYLTVSYNGESEYFLEETTIGSTIFTKDYCQNDYSVCTDGGSVDCYTCPLSQDAEDDLNMQDYLLDSLNSGFDCIETMIQSSDQDGELQKSIDEFKLEIKSEGCASVPEGEDCFSMGDVVDYINKK